jgi:SAM-dependent methyltransferase
VESWLLVTMVGTAAVQRELWSKQPRDWAELQEPQLRALYDAIVAGMRIRPGTRLLDAGCGSGLFCRIAADAGADVAGIDASPELLEIARERTPAAEFVLGDFEALPWPDGSFDVVTGIAAFSFTGNPEAALCEARRVLRPGGRVVIGTWGPADLCQAGVVLAALATLLPPAERGSAGPFRLSIPGVLEAFVAAGGLEIEGSEDVYCTWRYPTHEIALRALLAGGSAAAANRHASDDEVRAALERALAPHATDEGGYELENVFRYVVAKSA